jgi:hypothetical protein
MLQNQHDGQISKNLSIPTNENIPVSINRKSRSQLAPSCPEKRGVGHRRERGAGSGGRDSVGRETESQGGFPVSDGRHADEQR